MIIVYTCIIAAIAGFCITIFSKEQRTILGGIIGAILGLLIGSFLCLIGNVTYLAVDIKNTNQIIDEQCEILPIDNTYYIVYEPDCYGYLYIDTTTGLTYETVPASTSYIQDLPSDEDTPYIQFWHVESKNPITQHLFNINRKFQTIYLPQ